MDNLYRPLFLISLWICVARYDMVMANKQPEKSYMTDSRDSRLFKQFLDFAVEHNRSYILHKNMSETLWRFEVFKESLRRSQELNHLYRASDSGSAAVYGVNKFADMTVAEFKEQYLSNRQGNRRRQKGSNKFTSQHKHPIKLEELPTVVDWRKKSVLTPVKDQKQCGACWAFSVAETLESMSIIEHNNTKLHDLSEQQMIDCDKQNHGCAGGDVCSAALYAHQVGVVEESVYPLTRETGTCKNVSQAKRVKAPSYECHNWTGKEANLLQVLATHGPIAAAVDASSWHNYVEGIIRFHCSSHINHAVQIVGYNMEGEVPYYIIRNSWGKDFGDGGYLYVKYGDNLCGLSSEVVFVNASILE